MKKDNDQVTLGLDIGTSRIVLARQSGEGYEFQSQLNAFVSVPHTRMTAMALERDGVGFTVEDGSIVVHGNESPRFADLLNVETRRPMRLGVVNPAETASTAVMRRIIDTMTADATPAPARIGFTVPAPPLNGPEDMTYHEATLRQMLEERKHKVRPVNEGLAVVFSELEDTNYTGIGISCGGGLCNICLSYLAMPTMSFSIPKAGDFIDASAASATGDLATRVRITKEERFHFNGHFVDKLHQVLTVYYDDLIHALINAMKEAFSESRRMPRLGKPVPIVLSGGTASPAGFRDRFEKLFKASEFPIPVSEIRLARDPHTATARGALVAALAEM
jgi:hypothetical protein